MFYGRFSRISTGRLYGHTPSPGGGYRERKIFEGMSFLRIGCRFNFVPLPSDRRHKADDAVEKLFFRRVRGVSRRKWWQDWFFNGSASGESVEHARRGVEQLLQPDTFGAG